MKLGLSFPGKDLGVAGEVLDLLHGDDEHLGGGIDFQHLHVFTDGVADGLFDEQLLVVRKDHLDPIDHVLLLG